jgi:hypothetical protein
MSKMKFARHEIFPGPAEDRHSYLEQRGVFSSSKYAVCNFVGLVDMRGKWPVIPKSVGERA